MKRPAFTLLELLLVLALISVITGLGIRGYLRQHERAKFKSGVVGVQIDLNRVRLLAMRSGQAYLFRFIPGTGVYEIAPLETLQEAIYRMNDVDASDPSPLGGSLGADVYDDSSAFFPSSGIATSELYGAAQESLSDDLFAPENIQADMEEAGLRRSNARLATDSSPLGGSLSGSYDLATGGAPSLIGSTSSSSDPYASISADGMGTGGQFALGDETAFETLANQSTTLREMNTEERAIGATENTIAWRVNLAGLVVRKEATGGVVFTFSRLSESTPSNLKKRRPGAATNEQNLQTEPESLGEDLGSTLGGSLLSIPDASDAEGLGGGLTPQTSGVELYVDALANYQSQDAPQSLWSEPVIFYPNGRSSSVVVGLASLGKTPYYSEIGVRGMTGYARISSITSLPTGASPDESVLTQEQYFRISHPWEPYEEEGAATGLSGGSLGGSDATATTPSFSDVANDAGALGGTQGDALETPGLSSLDASSSQGLTPNYGSSERRSGYSFDVADVPSASTASVGAAQSGAENASGGEL